MSSIGSHSLQYKWVRNGMISLLCLNMLSTNFSETSETTAGKSLILLEGRQGGLIPEGMNLQQKVQYLTALSKEQSENLRRLRQEIHQLKGKLHLLQLTTIAEEMGNYKQLYHVLRQESAENKEKQNQQELLILQWKGASERENLKNLENESHAVALMTALESHAFSLEKMKEDYLEKERQNDHSLTHLTTLYNFLEAERNALIILISSQNLKEEKMGELADLLDSARINYQLLMLQAQNEKQEELQKIAEELQQERIKATVAQKNLDEMQQIYDQTVKLYNEMYIDYKSTQKQLESIQREIDERKTNHLVETDNLESKIDDLAMELKIRSDLSDELHLQLVEALAKAESAQELEHEHHKLTRDAFETKNALINNLETFSLYDESFKIALAERDHYLKIIDQQEKTLQQIYQDKLALMTQLENIFSVQDELKQLQENNTKKTGELAAVRDAYANHVKMHAWKDDFFTNAQYELESYPLIAAEHKKSIEQLLQEQERQKNLLSEKEEEIERLNNQYVLADEKNKQQLQEFTAILGEEKDKNDTLQKEIAEHLNQHHANQQKIQQMERLQEALQQIISEKAALQTEYQKQIQNEKILRDKLDTALAELEKIDSQESANSD